MVWRGGCSESVCHGVERDTTKRCKVLHDAFGANFSVDVGDVSLKVDVEEVISAISFQNIETLGVF